MSGCLSSQLDIMEPKVPEDIYKTHLEHAREWLLLGYEPYSRDCLLYCGKRAAAI